MTRKTTALEMNWPSGSCCQSMTKSKTLILLMKEKIVKKTFFDLICNLNKLFYFIKSACGRFVRYDEANSRLDTIIHVPTWINFLKY